MLSPSCPSCGRPVTLTTVKLCALKAATVPVGYTCPCGHGLRLTFYRDGAGGLNNEEIRLASDRRRWDTARLWAGDVAVRITSVRVGIAELIVLGAA